MVEQSNEIGRLTITRAQIELWRSKDEMKVANWYPFHRLAQALWIQDMGWISHHGRRFSPGLRSYLLFKRYPMLPLSQKNWDATFYSLSISMLGVQGAGHLVCG